MKQYLTFVTYTILASLIFNLTSCEYESDSFHYEGIIPQTPPEIGINLADVAPEGTIYIYTKTKLYYALNTSGKELLAQNFVFEGGDVSKVGDYIYLTPKSGDEKKYKLEVDVTLKSHSGSIADIVGVESFVGKYVYYIQYIDSDLKLNLRQETTQDKYFKLVWDNPDLEQTEVDHYEVSFDNIKGETQTITIDDPEKTYYVDNSYAYGYRMYTVKTYFKNGRIDSWTDSYTAQYRSLIETDFRINEYDNQNVQVSWIPNDFKCKYYISFPDNEPTTHYKTSSAAQLHRPPFPVVNTPAYVYILPENAAYSDYVYVTPIKVNISSNKFGLPIYGYVASREDDLIFGFAENQLISFSSDLNWLNAKLVSGTNSFSNISVVPSTPTSFVKVGTHNGNNTAYILNYDNENKLWIDEILSFEIPKTNSKYNLFTMTSNNRLYVSNTYLNNHYVNVYDILTGSILLENISLSGVNSSLAVSSDGRYMCEVTPTEVIIYEFWVNNNGELKQTIVNTFANSSAYTSCTFNPNNAKQVILSSNTSFCALNLYPTSFDQPIAGRFVNIDPFSGYILYSDANYIGNHLVHIMNPSIQGDVWQMVINPLYINKDIYLYNGNILIDSYYTNISGLYWQ